MSAYGAKYKSFWTKYLATLEGMMNDWRDGEVAFELSFWGWVVTYWVRRRALQMEGLALMKMWCRGLIPHLTREILRCTFIHPTFLSMLIFLLHALTVSLHFSLYSETPNHLLLNIRLIFKVTALLTSTLNTCVAAAAKSLQSCPTRLCHPWDSPGKNTGVGCHFLLQCMKVKSESEVAQSWLSATPWTAAY